MLKFVLGFIVGFATLLGYGYWATSQPPEEQTIEWFAWRQKEPTIIQVGYHPDASEYQLIGYCNDNEDRWVITCQKKEDAHAVVRYILHDIDKPQKMLKN